MAGLGLAAIDGTVSFLRAKQVLSKARYCRGEIGIVGTTLNDRVFLNDCLIHSIQIEPSLDRDRAMDTECLRVRGTKVRTSPRAYGPNLKRHFTRSGAGGSPAAAGSKRQPAG